MKRFRHLIIGFIIGAITFSFIPAVSESVNVLFNSINISRNGSTVANSGESYSLSDDTKVPYSILYKGTTYLPMREIGRLTGKDITWDNDTRTAGINDTNYYPTEIDEDEIVSYEDYKGLFYSINGEGFYDVRGEVSDIILRDGEFFIRIKPLLMILDCVEDNFEIIPSSNQFVDGEIIPKLSNYVAGTERIYTSATESYYVYKFFRRDNPIKVYEINYTKNDDNVILHQSAGYVKADHFLNFFGGNEYFEVILDYENNYIIFSINTK